MLPTAQHQIETARLTLRLVEAPDLPALLEFNSNDAVTRHLPYESWKSIEDAEAWYGRTCSRFAAGDAAQFVLVLRGSRRVIGTCLLFQFEKRSARAEIGYVLAQEYWGAGYMREALQGFIAFLFEQVGLRRLEAEVDPKNTASSRLLDRLGFVKEGLRRQRWSDKG